MKAKIIGISESFTNFSLGQEIEVSIKFLEDRMHELIIDGKKHIVEITKTIFTNNNTVVIESFISDNVNVGKIGIEFKYPV